MSELQILYGESPLIKFLKCKKIKERTEQMIHKLLGVPQEYLSDRDTTTVEQVIIKQRIKARRGEGGYCDKY